MNLDALEFLGQLQAKFAQEGTKLLSAEPKTVDDALYKLGALVIGHWAEDLEPWASTVEAGLLAWENGMSKMEKLTYGRGLAALRKLKAKGNPHDGKKAELEG